MKPLHLLVCGSGRRFVLWRPAVIGSGSEATLFASDPGVAARHAVVGRGAGGWLVAPEDGTVYVDGGRVGGPTPLRAGTRLAIGAVRMEVVAPSFPKWHLLVAAGLLLLAAVLAAGWFVSRQAHAIELPRLRLEANGPQVRWAGEGHEVELLLPLADPGRTLVDLRLDVKRDVELAVNGGAVRSLGPGSHRRIELGEGLVAGTNRIRVAARGGLPLGPVVAHATSLPVPACGAGACDDVLEQARARARRLLREERAAPGNLHDAWRWLRRARSLAAGAGAAAVRAEVEAELDRVEARLDERCAALEFAASRHLALDEVEAARAVVEELRAAFPEEDHACSAVAASLLQRIEGGGGR